MGRKSCMIRQCRFFRPGEGEILTIHRFPACPDKRLSWKAFVEQCNGTSLDGVSWMNCYLCSRHFHANAMTKPGPGRRVKPGHVPRLVITPAGMLREIMPPPISATTSSSSSSTASHQLQSHHHQHQQHQHQQQQQQHHSSSSHNNNNNSMRNNIRMNRHRDDEPPSSLDDHSEPESIWCHPLLEGMDCSESEESLGKGDVDPLVAAENEELKEKLRATELVFDTCHRSLKEKETIIQDLREMVKMKQRKIKRLEERVAQLESAQEMKMELTKGILELACGGDCGNLLHGAGGSHQEENNDEQPAVERSMDSAGVDEGEIMKKEEQQQHHHHHHIPPACKPGNPDNDPVILEFLHKLCSISPRYHELVLNALNSCLPQTEPPTTSTTTTTAPMAAAFENACGMRKWYAQLHEINRTLITQHQIRCTTNENVMESIKTVNQIVQKSARLRVGRPKANVITACREAIRAKNLETLTRVIQHGA